MSRRSIAIVLGVCALPAGLAVGVTFAGAVNPYYDPHPAFLIGTVLALALAWLLGGASMRAFGSGLLVAFVAPFALTLAWTGAFFLIAWMRYPDIGAAERTNRTVLRTIPVYPGLTFHDELTAGVGGDDLVEEGFLTPPDKIETTWAWSVRRGPSIRAVARWYEERLGAAGWDVRRDDPGEGSVFVLASRGDAAIELDVRLWQPAVDPAKIPVDESTTGAGEVYATAGL